MRARSTRIILAAIAAFYVVVGGLWITTYIPVRHYDEATRTINEMESKYPNGGAERTKEYQDARAYQDIYAMTHTGLEAEDSLSFYGSILLWGTIALVAGGAVMFLTRRNRAP